MARNRGWTCRIRGAGLFGDPGMKLYRSLVEGQPLVLIREPDNPNDANAIVVSDVMGSPCGYVERLVAADLAPIMDSGALLFAKVLSPLIIAGSRACWARATIWRDGTEEELVTTEKEKEII